MTINDSHKLYQSFGSEHALNNKGYAAEVHLIHYNSKYGQFDKALGQANGLAIISVLIEVTIEKMYYKK